MAQIGVVKVETPSGIVQVPVFDAGDSGSSVYEMVRVETPSGVGFIPAIDTASSPTFPYLKVNTQNNGILAFHDAATLSQTAATITLNGDTASITFYEDTDEDGLAENVETFIVTGGSQTFDASGFDLSPGNDVWWSVEFLDDGDVTDAGTIDEIIFE